MKKNKKKQIRKVEKNIYRFSIVSILILIVGIIYSRAALGTLYLEVQDLNSKIKKANEDNQSLEMKINEMISLDKIQKVSNELGLTYNNDNIKSVTE